MTDMFEFALAGGTEVRVRVRGTSTHSRQEFAANSRLFLWNVIERSPALTAAREALPTPTLRGEAPEVDKAYDAFNRAFTKAWRAEAQAALKALIEAEPRLAELGQAKLRFSRFAGCSCPCSPGGVLDERVVLDGRPVDFYVTLAGAQG